METLGQQDGRTVQEVMKEKEKEVTVSQGGEHVPKEEEQLAKDSSEAIASDDPMEGEEEEFDFDQSEGAEEEMPRWYAMAHFYSCQSSRGLFDEMEKAWNAKRKLSVQNLENNRYIIEFESEQMYNFVLDGGPWGHKGDALIMVSYDGLQRPSEVVIDAVNVWVRFYDVPLRLRKPLFSAVLAKKVSPRVLDGGGPVRNKNFLRAWVALPLDEPLKPEVEATIKDTGLMKFEVGYENVPFFCFICGRMGHSKRECPKEEEDSEEEELEEAGANRKRKLGEWM
ncbi:unnamed protein product [Urochloa humidicola]